MYRFVLSVPLLFLLSACSLNRLPTRMPQLPANLSSMCPSLPQPPEPLLDPGRTEWELDIISKYKECSVKHRKTVESWPVRKTKK